jgi:2-hydroxy-3-oxopropionate reductase
LIEINLVWQTAWELGLPLMGVNAIVPLMDALIAQGKGDLDFIAVLTLYEALGNMNQAAISD